MPLTLEWTDIALRLALTVLAGGLIGINRSEHGRAAGLRTTLLVCLAASLAMIMANLLLATTGKTAESFAVLDPMRLALGILTGMGFIGAGAIMRRGEMIVGVTTAATLWLVTVIGLCLGAGLAGLGVAVLALALIILWGLKRLELLLSQDRHGTLVLIATPKGPTEEEVRRQLEAVGCWFAAWGVTYKGGGESQRRTIRAEVRWHARANQFQAPAFLQELSRNPEVRAVHWTTT